MMGTPGNRSTEPGLQGLQNRKAARQWAAFFAITLPRQSSTDKKDTQTTILVRGAPGFHRNGPTMRGRALDCRRNRGRAGTNPGTPERPSETGTAALRTGQATTLCFSLTETFIGHPAVSVRTAFVVPAVGRSARKGCRILSSDPGRRRADNIKIDFQC